MEWVLIGKLVLIVFLVVGNAFFVGSEIALTSARRSRIKQLANTGNRSAKIVQLLHNEPERFYSVTQIGITLVSLGLGAIGIITLTQIIGPSVEVFFGLMGDSDELMAWAQTLSYIMAFIIISFLHVVGGELAPKVLAFHKAEVLSLSVARTINWMHTIMRPLIWVMNKSSNGLLRLFGQGDLAEAGEAHFSMTGEEIRTILSASEQEGALDAQLTMMLRGVFDLDDHTARDAMVPRTEVEAVEHTATVTDLLKLFKGQLRERYPVYETSMDNIVGIASMKELLHRLAHTEDPSELAGILELSAREVMMEPYFVPDSMRLSQLLTEFTNNRRQMAVVLDEYGGTEGLITLEDILEEIVGEYEDEFSPRHRHIRRQKEGQFIINGMVRVTELEPKLNFPFPTGDYVTLGGLINHRLERIAEVGDVVYLEGGRLKVLDMVGHRITKVKFDFQVQETEDEEGVKTEAEAADAEEFSEVDERDDAPPEDSPVKMRVIELDSGGVQGVPKERGVLKSPKEG
jgi:CBS domain containing-hemolysin-like protein